MTTAPAGQARHRYRYLGPAVVAAVTVAVWFAWLGRDTQKTLDPVTMQESGPYTAAQIAGCVLSLVAVLVVAVLAGVHPASTAVAMTVAFTVAWTVQMASTDDTGLFAVGAVLLAVSLAAGTSLVAFITSELRKRFARR
jgi:hypothetical protein